MSTKKIFVIVFVLGLMGCKSGTKDNTADSDEWADMDQKEIDLYSGLEFEMPKIQLPVFPDNRVNIVDFGAKGDGISDNSLAFEQAIEQVSGRGGGRVVIPRGIWKTGPIILKSNINLHAEKGALVVFDDDFDKYPLIATSFEGLETYRCLSPIYGNNLENIAITGEGIFDGSGGSWRAVKKSKMPPPQWKALVKSGGVLSDDEDTWYPSEMSKKGDVAGNFNVPDFDTKEEHEAIKDFLRPVMVSLIGCKKVLLDGPTFQNSPAWNLHPLMCEDVTLRNLTIRNPWYSQNGDGLDLESCKNAAIYNCSFDVGDDAICFKSGKNEDGLKRAMPTENVIVKNNVVYHGHGGFVVGSEMSGGVKNVHISKCTFIGTDCGLRFKSTRGRGGVVENIYISEINMIDIPTEAIRFNLYYGGDSPIPDEDQTGLNTNGGEMVAVSRTTPIFRNIYMKNITAVGGGAAAFFQGLPEMKLKNIHMENVVLEAKNGITLIDASDISMINMTVLQREGSALTLFNTNGLNLDGFKAPKDSVPVFRVFGEESRNIVIKNSKLNMDAWKLSAEVDAKVITIN